jgi:uncharacterized lipoprotein YmbA
MKTALCAMTVACVAAALAGCSSTPPTHFYRRVAPPPRAGNAAKAVPAPRVRVEVLPVSVPVQVDLPQMVVRLADDSVTVLEHERWIAPLGDEIRQAVALRIGQALADVVPSNAAGEGPWRVTLDVQRFDAMLHRAASVQLQWSLQGAANGVALRCQASYEQPAGVGAEALSAAYRAVFERLGDVIGQAIKVAATGGTPSCG